MLKRGYQIGLMTVVIVSVLLTLSVIYQQVSINQDMTNYPAPGELIDVNGHQVHLYCIGEGTPTLIIDTGAADWSLSWITIQEDLATLTRTCIYDRAGLGWSEASNLPRNSQELAEELHTLLQNAEVATPYILLGHSLGGYNARIYYEQYPEDVVGMILLESAHPDQWNQLPSEVANLVSEQSSLLHTMGLLTNFGIVRFILPAHPHLSDDLQATYRAHMTRSRHLITSGQEISGGLLSAEQARQTSDLGDLPLIVTTAAHSFDAFRDFTDAIPFENADTIWQTLQTDLTTLSSNSVHLISPIADHNIQFTDPDIILESVRQVLNMIENP